MSTKLVREKIVEFLKSGLPEVLCIRGNWGTGKTYTWNDVLNTAAKAEGGLACEKYAYVSLFGLNNVEDVKREIVNQTIARDRIGAEFDPSNLSSIYNDGVSVFKKNSGFVGKLFENYYGAAISVMTLLIRNRLICIDDLERKGDQLRITDVMGLISQLKEERQCKVVLLLNDEQLRDRTAFEGYLEKVVDINLSFTPTAQESVEIALKGLEGDARLKEMVKDRATALSIDNVRVIRKLFGFAEQAEPLVKGYKAGVLESVVSSIVLLGWCHLQPEVAPSVNFIMSRQGIYAGYNDDKEGALTPEQQKWVKLLDDYGYAHTDELDTVLLNGIQDGYFSREKVDRHADALNDRVEANEAAEQIRRAWRTLFDTFNGTVDEGLAPFLECFSTKAKYYSLNETIGVVNAHRTLDRAARGDELFEFYVQANRDFKGAFDISGIEMYGTPVPEDLQVRLAELDVDQDPKPAVDELFLMLDGEGYNSDVTEALAAVRVEEYVQVLKRHEGEDFLKIRRGLTQWRQLVNPSEAHEKIMRNAGLALKQIQEESPLNKYRVQSWGLVQRLDRAAAVGVDAAPQEQA